MIEEEGPNTFFCLRLNLFARPRGRFMVVGRFVGRVVAVALRLAGAPEQPPTQSWKVLGLPSLLALCLLDFAHRQLRHERVFRLGKVFRAWPLSSHFRVSSHLRPL